MLAEIRRRMSFDRGHILQPSLTIQPQQKDNEKTVDENTISYSSSKSNNHRRSINGTGEHRRSSLGTGGERTSSRVALSSKRMSVEQLIIPEDTNILVGTINVNARAIIYEFLSAHVDTITADTARLSEFEAIVQRALTDATQDFALINVLNSAGWIMGRFCASTDKALDANSLFISLSNLYLHTSTLHFAFRRSSYHRYVHTFTLFLHPTPHQNTRSISLQYSINALY